MIKGRASSLMELLSKPIEYVGRFRDQTAQAYRLTSERDQRLARLFINRGTYTLAWFGRVEFDSLRELLWYGLLRDVFGVENSRGWPPSPWYLGLQLSLIVYNRDVSTLGEPFLDSSENDPRLIILDAALYDDLGHEFFWEPNRISFARADYTINSGIWQSNMSFTAENPKTKQQSKAEIAIKTPRSYRYSNSLLSFIDETIRGAAEPDSRRDESISDALQQQLDTLVHGYPLP